MTIVPILHNEIILGEFLRQGFKPEDILVVVNYMRKEFSRCIPPSTTPTWLRMVRWPRLITDAPEFAGYLALARASLRNARPPRDQRQAVLQATGRPADEARDVVKTPASILGDVPVTQEHWKRWRESQAGL